MSQHKIPYKIYLQESEMPTRWYNLRADMKNKPAPESSHAIRAAIDEAVRCRETGEEKTILFGLTGTGYFDLVAYEKFNDKEMNDYIPTDEDLQKGFAGIPRFPGNMD